MLLIMLNRKKKIIEISELFMILKRNLVDNNYLFTSKKKIQKINRS